MRLVITFFVFFNLFAQTIPKKSILFLIAPKDFRDEEFSIPYETLKKLDYKIIIASYDTLMATGMLGMKVKPDKRIKDIDTNAFQALVVVGGSGARVFFDDTTIHKIVRHFSKKKILAAICISPLTLLRAGVLKGKKATVWKDEKLIAEFKKRGAKYQPVDVVRDGNILTASGPSAAKRFASELAQMLKE
ncbi:MAG: DJ-1/PfpI family protein [candidate division WOR-3 bacterium]